jgi:hypothetical protein
MPEAIMGLIIKVATDWHSAANKPNETPTAKLPRVRSQAWVSLPRRPQAMATITPDTSKLAPSNVQPHKVSPKKTQAKHAENKAWEANKTPLRRGPNRFMQANKAVSPMKMPINPDKANHATLGPSKLRHSPVYKATAHSKTRAKNKRQRVKEKAPNWLAAVAENKLPKAQHKAAKAAKYSAGKGLSCQPPSCG